MLRRLLLIGVVLGLLFVIGCSKDNEKDGKEDEASITIWHNFSGEDLRAQTVQQIIKDFQSDNPDIKLDVTEIPVDAYRERIGTAAAAKELPDVFLGYPGSFTDEYHKGDLIQPITPLFEEHPEWKAGFLEGAFTPFEYEDGQIYSAPVAISATSFLYYNKDKFEDNNIEVPKTWDELLTAVDKFNDLGITPISIGNKEAWVAQSTTFGAIADRVTGTDWFLNAVKQDNASFTDDTFLDALGYFKELVDKNGYQDGANGIDNTQAEQYFAQGNAAMIINGSWTISGLAGTTSEDVMKNVGVTTVPAITEGAGRGNTITGGPGGGFLLNSKSEGMNKDAALELIYALSNADAQKAIAESEALVMYDVEIKEDEVSPLFYQAFNLLRESEFAPVYDIHLPSAAAEAVNNGLQDIMLGQDVLTVAEKIQAAHEKAIK